MNYAGVSPCIREVVKSKSQRRVKIFSASITDIEELTAVEITSKLQSFEKNGAEAIDYSTRKHWWHTYFNGRSPASAKPERIVYKAVTDGKIVGYIAGHLTNRFDKDAEIQSFYVLKDEQRQGIGSKLFENLLNWLVTKKATSLCVGIGSENPYRAFYIRYGGEYLNPHWIYWDNIKEIKDRIIT